MIDTFLPYIKARSRASAHTISMSPFLTLLGRILLAFIFVAAAPRHFTAEAVAHARDLGVPLASWLVPLSGAMALAGGLGLLFGVRVDASAWLLVAFLVPVTLGMHAYGYLRHAAVDYARDVHRHPLALGSFVLCSFALATAPARADVPPDPGYVEACTVEIQQRPSEHCEYCPSSYETPQQCPQHYTGTTFVRRCQGYGASSWTELWCDGPAIDPLPAPHSGGCAVGTPGASSMVGVGLLALLATMMRLARSTR